MNRRSWVLAGCAAALFAVVVGCSKKEAGTPSAAENASSVPTAVSTAPGPTIKRKPTNKPRPPTAVTPPTHSTTPNSGFCKLADLDATLGASEGTAGTMYRALVLTNVSRRSCTVQGFPEVAFVASDDWRQVGEMAVHVGEKGPVIRLAAGAAAAAPVGFVDINNFDPEVCQAVPVRGLMVIPPRGSNALLVPYKTIACSGPIPSGQLSVRTLHRGSGLE